MFKILEKLDKLKEDVSVEESDDILDSLKELTHPYFETDDGVSVLPWFCMLEDILDNYGLSEKEMIDLAEENGYKIARLNDTDMVDTGLIVCAPELDIKDLEDKLHKNIDENITVKLLTKEVPTQKERVKRDTKKVEKTEESIKEEFMRVSDEELKPLEDAIVNNGFKIVSKRDYGHYGPNFDGAYDIHYQIITVEGNQDKESFEKYITWFEELLDNFEDDTGSPCTFNMGLQTDGYISCGFDVRAIYYKPGEDVVHTKPTTLTFRDGKPADNYTNNQLKDIGKRMNIDVDDLLDIFPVDKPMNKKEGLDEDSRAYALYGYFHGKDGSVEPYYKGTLKPLQVGSQEEIRKAKKDFESSWNATNTKGIWKFVIRELKEDLNESEEEVVEETKEYKIVKTNSISYKSKNGVAVGKPIKKPIFQVYFRTQDFNPSVNRWMNRGWSLQLTDFKTLEDARAYVNKYGKTLKSELDEELEEPSSLEAKVQKVFEDNYDEETQLHIFNNEDHDDYWVEEFDDGSYDFNKFTEYQRTPEELNEGKPVASFIIFGGMNGSGTWREYLDKLEDVFDGIFETTGYEPLLYKLDTDICDDVWTAYVFMYDSSEHSIEESLKVFREKFDIPFDAYKEKLNPSDIIPEEEQCALAKGVVIYDDDGNVVDEDIEKHDTLNPVLFDGIELKPEIKEAIQKIVDEFVSDLKEDGIKFDLKDVLLIGSNVNYNYTKDSDLDIHIIADSSNLSCPDNLYPLLYSAYRSIFDKNYNITIKGIPAEIFVEMDEPHGSSNGAYSLYNGWIKTPEQKNIPELNREAFNILFNEWEDKYTELLNKDNITSDDIKQFITDLYALRQEGILQSGEFDIKNLVFKEFRNLGYLDDLKAFKKELKGKELSLENLDEEMIKNNVSRLYKLLGANTDESIIILSANTDGRDILDKESYNTAIEVISKGVKAKGMWNKIEQPDSFIIRGDAEVAKKLAKDLCQKEFILIKFNSEDSMVAEVYHTDDEDYSNYKKIDESSMVVFDNVNDVDGWTMVDGAKFQLGIYGAKELDTFKELDEAYRNKETGEVGNILRKFDNGYVLFQNKEGGKSTVSLDDLEEVEDTKEVEDKVTIDYAPKFEDDLEDITKDGNDREFEWFFEDDGSLEHLRRNGFEDTLKKGRIEYETIKTNNKFKNNTNNVTIYALKKGVNSHNQFRAYFYRDGDKCVFVRGHLKRQGQNGPKEYKCIQDTIDYANTHMTLDKKK